MKTSDIEIRDLLSVLSVVGVENRIGEVPGVESVTVNHAAGLATVRYDETRLNITEIKSAVRQGEYEPAGPAATQRGGADGGHTPPVASPATPPPTASKSPPEATGAAPAGPADPAKSATSKPGASPVPPAAAKPSSVAAPLAAGTPAPEAATSAADAKAPDKAAMDKG